MTAPPLADLGSLLAAAEDLHFDDLFGGDADVEGNPHADPRSGPVQPSDELDRVVVSVALPYARVVAELGARLLSGRAEAAALDELDGALTALGRLAEVDLGGARTERVEELRRWVEEARGEASRLGARRLDRLRELLPRLGDAFGGEIARELRGLVDCDPSDHPLLADLAHLDGIGPRRLLRLYAAGLFTPEVLSEADPDDVAVVTGLPRALARRVVQAALGFGARRRRQLVLGFESRLAEFRRVVEALDPDCEPELSTAARVAIAEMARLVRTVSFETTIPLELPR